MPNFSNIFLDIFPKNVYSKAAFPRDRFRVELNNWVQINLTFPRDRFHLEPSNWVWINLTFPRDRFHLELMLENCVGDICLAGVPENNRRADAALHLICFELHLRPIQTYLEPFHPFPRIRLNLGPNSKVDPVETN